MNKASRREFLAATAGALAAAALGKPAHAAGRPNMVFIMADDLGYAELGCYGNTFNATPNLDRLASQGMRFTQAYAAAPVCSPTRASVATGQYPVRVGINDYLRADDPNHLSPELTTLAEPLRAAGYATGYVGKWHLMGDYAARRGDPRKHGYDEVMCSETRYIGGGDYFAPYEHLPEVEGPEGEFLPDRLGREAADFIARHSDGPFFLSLDFYSVHTGLAAPKEDIAKYKQKSGAGKNHNNPVLAAMLEHQDAAVGRVMDALDAAGVADNTLLVFFSDNGGETRVTTNAPLRGGKSQLYEGGIREPMIVRWPGRVAAGTVCDVPVCSIDFLPTFHAAAGVSVGDQPVDGVDLTPVLMEEGTFERGTLYWHYPLEKPHFLGGRSAGAVRHGDWKLIHFYDDNHLELYNLAKDVGESNDLAAEQPEQAEVLRFMHATWLRQFSQ